MPTVYFNYATITTGDNVPVNVTKVYEDGGEVHKDLMLSDAALTKNGSLPTAGRAHSTAWPRPSARPSACAKT